MIKIATLIYYICVIVVSLIISEYWLFNNWQWWAIILCLCVARICGIEEERDK